MNPDDRPSYREMKETLDLAQMKKELLEVIFSDSTLVKLLRGEELKPEPEPKIRSSVVEGYLRGKGVDCG